MAVELKKTLEIYIYQLENVVGIPLDVILRISNSWG